jgi:hypothetical protein
MITVNATAMFSHREPWDCANSVANLGERAGELTWACAMGVARNARDWLVTPLPDALSEIADWAQDTGAWSADEIEAWSDEERLALLVQNVASDLRALGSDDNELETCVGVESEQVSTWLYLKGDYVFAEWSGC